MDRAIWWVRRDLRLTDNQALTAALVVSREVVPVFIIDPRLMSSAYVGSKRIAFLFGGLRALDSALRQRGSQLIIRQGQPVKALQDLIAESGASAIYAEADISPYGRRRDARMMDALPLYLTGGLTVHPPGSVLKQDGEPYIVYTPFSKAWKALPRPGQADLLPAPGSVGTPAEVASLAIPDEPVLPEQIPFEPGEEPALRRLDRFVTSGKEGIYGYGDRRNRPDLEGTSGLSPYIRFGMLSLRQAVVAAGRGIDQAPDESGRKSAETWLNELIWREFYLAILYHFPHVRQRSFRSQYDSIPWANDEADFEAWCQGRTGYPIVDAAMRQLVESGWMHNRSRMIVASFLVKDLLIDWRWGERFFMEHLVDGDPAPNNGGWQWTAGTGTDAAPYFRIFNPILQSKKHDPDGDYIRRWLPELSSVPDKYIHEPWRMPDDTQRQSNCRIGRDYPRPIIDHGVARERTLKAYKVSAD
ncbi:MAG: deoxyribodipyrimidine photo-lyase [Chloroflexota bacterium]